MPRLVQKNDGLYIVHHFYQQNTTWQIDSDGVQFLQGGGVRPGELFPTDLFMQLWTRGTVYTSTSGRGQPEEPNPDALSPDDLALGERAVKLYEALYHCNLEEAYTFLFPRIRGSKTLDQFKRALIGARGSRVTSWKIQSVCSSPLQDHKLPEAARVGLVVMNLGIQDNSGDGDSLYNQEEYWYQVQGAWYCAWPRWKRKAAAAM